MAGGPNPIAVLNLVDIVAKDLQKKETPEAYLIYALYDEDSNRYEVGKKVLTRNAANQHEELEEKIAIKKNGYIETFVVNETTQDVWFDNFKILSQGDNVYSGRDDFVMKVYWSKSKGLIRYDKKNGVYWELVDEM